MVLFYSKEVFDVEFPNTPIADTLTNLCIASSSLAYNLIVLFIGHVPRSPRYVTSSIASGEQEQHSERSSESAQVQPIDRSPPMFPTNPTGFQELSARFKAVSPLGFPQIRKESRVKRESGELSEGFSSPPQIRRKVGAPGA